MNLQKIPGYSKYLINTKGQIFSTKRTKLYELTPINKKGYLFVKLYNDDNKRKFIGIHRLVALTFIPEEDLTKEVNHINKNRSDNRVENLEWISHTDNVRYSRQQKLKVIWDNGNIRIFSHVSDFDKEFNWKSGNVQKYIREYNSYSKKHGMFFELID